MSSADFKSFIFLIPSSAEESASVRLPFFPLPRGFCPSISSPPQYCLLSPLPCFLVFPSVGPGSKYSTDLALQVIEGLEAAEAAGVLHRDVKSANCFIDGEGRVKIGDFGLSLSICGVEDTRLTMSGTILGTPGFAAPEQLRGGTADVRADIYCLLLRILGIGVAGEIGGEVSPWRAGLLKVFFAMPGLGAHCIVQLLAMASD